MFVKTKFDFTKSKTLLIMLNDNMSGNVQFVLPPFVDEIEEHAEFVRYVITPEDIVVSDNGVEERTFEIYRDFARKNLYYLVQRGQLQISSEPDFVLKKEAGSVNVSKLLRDRYFDVIKSIKEDIVKDFDAFVFVRFKFTGEPVSTVHFVMSKDFANKVPTLFTDTVPSPYNFSMRMKDQILTPTLSLYLIMPNRKVFYDISLSTMKISRVVSNKITYTVDLSEYLDDFFKQFLQTIYPI